MYIHLLLFCLCVSGQRRCAWSWAILQMCTTSPSKINKWTKKQALKKNQIHSMKQIRWQIFCSLSRHRVQNEKGFQDLDALLNNKSNFSHVSHFCWSQPLFSNTSFALSNAGGLQAFRRFLRSEFSEENLKFWLACENYRGSPSKTKASSIYNQFINPDAPQEVSARVQCEQPRVALCCLNLLPHPLLRWTWMLRLAKPCWRPWTRCVQTASMRHSRGSTVWWQKTPSPGSCVPLSAQRPSWVSEHAM